jgi:glutamine synthetase
VYGTGFKKMASPQMAIVEEVSLHIEAIKRLTDAMTAERRSANALEHIEKKAAAYCDQVKPHFDEIRYHCDNLETLVADDLWPLAKYRELLFLK